MFESEEDRVDKENLKKMVRRDEHINMLLTILEVLLKKHDPRDAATIAKELTLDLMSHIDDVHPLPDN